MFEFCNPGELGVQLIGTSSSFNMTDVVSSVLSVPSVTSEAVIITSSAVGFSILP